MASAACCPSSCKLPSSYFETGSKHRLDHCLSLGWWPLVESDTGQKMACLEGRALSPRLLTRDRAKSETAYVTLQDVHRPGAGESENCPLGHG